MRFRGFALVLACAAAAVACEDDEPTPQEKVAALADLTVRQLIAGLNSKNELALAGLLVVTSTSGGAPRHLRRSEFNRLVYPDGPYEYQGAGKPGTMVLRDGKKEKRVIRLIEVGGAYKVLATSEPLETYLAREQGGTAQPVLGGARVVTFMSRE